MINILIQIKFLYGINVYYLTLLFSLILDFNLVNLINQCLRYI